MLCQNNKALDWAFCLSENLWEYIGDTLPSCSPYGAIIPDIVKVQLLVPNLSTLIRSILHSSFYNMFDGSSLASPTASVRSRSKLWDCSFYNRKYV